MYSLTFRHHSPKLFISLLVALLLTIFKFKTFNFSLFLAAIMLSLEYFYRLPIFPYELSKSKLKKLDNRLGLYNDKSLDQTYVVSPCYGTIKAIEVKDGFTRIISTLSLLDVHYQFSPIDGQIKSIQYKPGELYIAYLLEKSKYNERKHTIFTNNGLDVEVIQIAGVITRRIETFGKNGDKVSMGQPYGIIHFGSRVDTIVPNSYNGKSIGLLIKVGDKLDGPMSRICIYE